MRKLSTFAVSLLSIFASAVFCRAQTTGGYLARLERQTREENVCLLVQQNGQYHLERTAAGGARVFEGTLEAPAISELGALLSAQRIVDLKPGQIDMTQSGADVDQTMITIPRSTGWQKLIFPSAKSRKPFKGEVDPILNWLDHNKQQQNPIAGATGNRCVPGQTSQAVNGVSTSNTANPYMMRVVVDRYELAGGGTAMSSVSAAKGTTGQSVGGMTNTDAMNPNSFKITHTCAVIYQNGRYRFEKNVRDKGTQVKSEVYRDTLGKSQLDELRQLLDTPKLVALPNNSAPSVFGREGEVITLAVPRDKTVQGLAFASFAPRPASADLREATYTALMSNLGVVNPVRKWVKQNIEDNKGALAKDVPATTCIPSAQPE